MPDTADHLLDVAERLVQQRGVHAFSFRDLAAPLGITTAGVHYHFPSKAVLVRALVARYRRTLAAALADLDRTTPEPAARLAAFVGYYELGVRAGQFCLCGMLATDTATLAGEVQAEVRGFFEDTEAWLARTLGAGRDAGTLAFDGAPNDEAVSVLASVEGGMLAAWAFLPLGSDRAAARYGQATTPVLSRLGVPGVDPTTLLHTRDSR